MWTTLVVVVGSLPLMEVFLADTVFSQETTATPALLWPQESPVLKSLIKISRPGGGRFH